METYNKILCIDDDFDFLTSLRLQLKELFKVVTATSLKEGLFILERELIDFVLLDVHFDDENGIEQLGTIKAACPNVEVVILSADRDPKLIVEAIRRGAADYLTKPFDATELMAVTERLSARRRMSERYAAVIESQNACFGSGIIFKSAAIGRVFAEAQQLKGHKANVLIAGETGTGKELLARYIHRIEGKPSRPFVAVNCAAIPQNLIEAELFGAEAGAYTGAVRRRIGKFELADGGDIFLDEVGALKPDLQVKILRVLQEREITRLGGNDQIKTDFRVISATNEPLEKKVASGEFRMDLYHRLRVIEFSIPPLRERCEDIPVLVEYYLGKFVGDDGAKRVSLGAMEKLMAYHWPGNVRELANVIQSLSILAPEEVIDATAFPKWLMNGCGSHSLCAGEIPVPSPGQNVGALKNHLASAERRYIEFALRACKGNRSEAARILCLGRTTLYGKMKELGLM